MALTITQQQIADEIIAVASRFVGLTEIKPNSAFDDLSTPGADARANELRSLLLSTKWPLGAAYCAAFTEAVWIQAHKNLSAPPGLIAEISNKFTPSVILTYRNWGAAIEKDPVRGSVFFWEKGHSGTGHAGIVTLIHGCEQGDSFETIEGNTSRGSGGTIEQQRNGDGIYARTRKIDRAPGSNKMWLRGFLHPKGW